MAIYRVDGRMRGPGQMKSSGCRRHTIFERPVGTGWKEHCEAPALPSNWQGANAPPLKISPPNDNLVTMTRLTKSKASKAKKPRRRRGRQPGHWLLQDAKARFSELVRRVRTEGPQHVTVHGRDEVVVIAADEFRRLKGDLTGQALVAAMQASPYREIDLEPARSRLPVRDVDL